jgi:hypothetical protein
MSDKQRTSSPSDVREYVIDWLRQELVGPAPGYPMVQLNGEEILRPQDPPRYRYGCGILFPQGTRYSGGDPMEPEEVIGVQTASEVDEGSAIDVEPEDQDQEAEAPQEGTTVEPGTGGQRNRPVPSPDHGSELPGEDRSGSPGGGVVGQIQEDAHRMETPVAGRKPKNQEAGERSGVLVPHPAQ